MLELDDRTFGIIMSLPLTTLVSTWAWTMASAVTLTFVFFFL